VSQSIHPTEIFNRAFYESEKGHLGLWQPDAMTEEPLRRHARELREAVNASLQEQRERVESPVPSPSLYFDLIESTRVNAAAKEVDGLYMVGVTRAFLTTVPDVIKELLSRDSVWKFLLITTDGSTEERRQAEEMIFNTLFVFVTNHELGHIVHGHVTCESEEWNRLKSDVSAVLPKQAAEIEADGYSCFATLNWLFSRVSSDSESVGVPLLRIFLLAALGYLESGAVRIWDWNAMASFSHPQYLSRVDFILGHTIGWCEERHPQIVRSLPHDVIHKGLEAIQNCWQAEDARPLEAQVDELVGGPYRQWEAQIATERVRLRGLLAPFAWRVRGYSDLPIGNPTEDSSSSE
jgi:hypothetical protein